MEQVCVCVHFVCESHRKGNLHQISFLGLDMVSLLISSRAVSAVLQICSLKCTCFDAPAFSSSLFEFCQEFISPQFSLFLPDAVLHESLLCESQMHFRDRLFLLIPNATLHDFFQDLIPQQLFFYNYN